MWATLPNRRLLVNPGAATVEENTGGRTEDEGKD
jgi:hypothetical protein